MVKPCLTKPKVQKKGLVFATYGLIINVPQFLVTSIWGFIVCPQSDGPMEHQFVFEVFLLSLQPWNSSERCLLPFLSCASPTTAGIPTRVEPGSGRGGSSWSKVVFAHSRSLDVNAGCWGNLSVCLVKLCKETKGTWQLLKVTPS